MYIVQGQQAESQDLVADVEMTDVGSGKSRARRAGAGLVERSWIVPEFGSLDIEPSIGGEDGAISSHSRRGDAVKEVYSAADSFDDVIGKPNAHEITGPVFHQGIVYDVEHFVHRRFLFANRQSANAEPIPIVHRGDRRSSFSPELRVDPSL